MILAPAATSRTRASPGCGVIRAAALARTSPHGSYDGFDKVLLAELAPQRRLNCLISVA
jgi:hypothetical protein